MESNKVYQQRLSETITWLRFPLIFFIIMLHCYSVVRLNGEHEVYFKAVYPFALWLGETGVPSFFFISGYLFFLSKKKYTEKIKTRIHTLLIPYVIWNSIILLLYILAYHVDFPQEINGRSLADYTAIDYIRLYWDRGEFDNGNFVPLLCPLWYIRNLMIMSILSPLLYYIIKYTREIFIFGVTAWWMMTYHNAFMPQTILFFCFGAYFSILNINPIEVIIKHKTILIALFIVFAIGDILSHTTIATPINLQVHRLSLMFNISALLLLGNYYVQYHNLNKLWSNSAFIVFCVHYPIVVLLRKICISQFYNTTESAHILLYFICVIASTFLSVGIYLLFDKFFPNAKRILSGNR